MCGGGGGGGDGGAVERKAAEKAAEEARVASAVNSINSVFGINSSDPSYQSRETMYSAIRDDARNKALVDLNKDRGITERENNFTLARQGLSGGSRDVDTNREILDRYQQGVLSAANMGDSVANNARMNDDRTRVNLINNIRSGLDQGSATQMAYEGMRNNVNNAQNEAAATNLTGFFNALMPALQGVGYSNGYNQTLNQQLAMQKQLQGNQPVSSATSNYDGSTKSIG